MVDQRRLQFALAEMASNPEQQEAVQMQEHGIVLAGPGSGKTKTLTTAMARCLLEEVIEPRGIACITYNTECALELESRLSLLGVEPDYRVFIGTVHSFALTQVILPYARCVMPEIPSTVRVATPEEKKAAVVTAYDTVISGIEDPHERWKFAETKRRTHVDRRHPDWMGRNPELAQFIEAYEKKLRRRELIDFDDMPLLALRMIQENPWIRTSLKAKFPVLFVDEYQDLGYALHALVQLLCFEGGIRLFAVGDPDQSIYGFLDAEPRLLRDLTKQKNVRTIKLRFNYRCGTSIINASQAALGEERNYRAPDGTDAGRIRFYPVQGDLDTQAKFVVYQLVPALQKIGIQLGEIGILYREAWLGKYVADKAVARGLPIVRADNQALVRRNSPLARFVEACASWAAGGWRYADPPFRRLLTNAAALVYGGRLSDEERRKLEAELMTFLLRFQGHGVSANDWLKSFRSDLILPWRARARTATEEWDKIDDMIKRTDLTSSEGGIPLTHLGGRIEGNGRLNFSTLHSAKGREFDAVILFGMNDDVLPKRRENTMEKQREARRLFYVGVTRARKELYLVFQKGCHSPWVPELHQRAK